MLTVAVLAGKSYSTGGWDFDGCWTHGGVCEGSNTAALAFEGLV